MHVVSNPKLYFFHNLVVSWQSMKKVNYKIYYVGAMLRINALLMCKDDHKIEIIIYSKKKQRDLGLKINLLWSDYKIDMMK